MKRYLLFFIVMGLCNGLWGGETSFKSRLPYIAKMDFSDSSTQEDLAPYFLPHDHPLRPVLDQIFKPGVISNADSFERAGFTILLHKRSSHSFNAHWVLARHPLVYGYLFKVFLNDEKRLKKNEGWNKLVDRCKGAERIRNLIKKKGIKNFVVPDKWLYQVPLDKKIRKNLQQPVVLMVTDMQLASRKKNRDAWKEAGKEQLDELYTLLSNGLGSTFLTGNLPYAKGGKFACIDTEGHVRPFDMQKIKLHISKEMHPYWNKLMRTRPQFVGQD